MRSHVVAHRATTELSAKSFSFRSSLVWTFVGRRCYACGPIVRTVGEHGISRNVIPHATTKPHGVPSDECARTSERDCWFRPACSRTTYASRDLPGRHAKTGFRTPQNGSVALRRLSHSHAWSNFVILRRASLVL